MKRRRHHARSRVLPHKQPHVAGRTSTSLRKFTVNGLIPLDSRGIAGLDRGRLTGNDQFARRAVTFFSTGPALGTAFPPELHRLWWSTFELPGLPARGCNWL